VHYESGGSQLILLQVESQYASSGGRECRGHDPVIVAFSREDP